MNNKKRKNIQRSINKDQEDNNIHNIFVGVGVVPVRARGLCALSIYINDTIQVITFRLRTEEKENNQNLLLCSLPNGSVWCTGNYLQKLHCRLYQRLPLISRAV